MAGLAHRKPGSSGLERLLVRDLGRRGGTLPGGAQVESLRRDRGNHPQAAAQRIGNRSRGQNRDESRTIDVSSGLLRDHPAGAVRPADGARGDSSGAVGVAARPRDQTEIAILRRHEHHRAISVERVANGGGRLVAEQFRKRRGVDEPPDDRIICVDGREWVGGLGRRQLRRRLLRFDEIARGAERFEHRGRQSELMLGLRARTRPAGEAAERKMAQARSGNPRRSTRTRSRSARCRGTPRTGGRPLRAALRAAEGIRPTRQAWHGRRCGSRRCPIRVSASDATASREQGLARDEIRLNRLGRRRLGGDLVRELQRLLRCPAPCGEFRFEHSNRPLVPLVRSGLRSCRRLRRPAADSLRPTSYPPRISAICASVSYTAPVISLNCVCPLDSSARSRTCSARSSLPTLHENLTERGERNRQAASRAVLLLQRRAPFGQRERLFMAMLKQRDVRLIVRDDAEHVLRMHRRRKPLGLPERRHGLLDAAALRESHDPTANAATQGSAGFRRRAAPERPLRCARGRWPCRRPACSSVPARSARGRSPPNRAPARHAAARGRAAQSRATDRLWQTRCGREAATVSRAARAGDRRGVNPVAVRASLTACATSSPISQASASVQRRPISSSCLSPDDFSACVRMPIASAWRPRSKAARARANAG